MQCRNNGNPVKDRALVLKNKTIAILENRAGKQLADLVRKYGGTPFSAPALAEVPDIDPKLIAALIASWRLQAPDVFIFQTGVGVKALFATLDRLALTEQFLKILASSLVVVRGVKPSSALRAHNVRIDIAAVDPFTTAEVLIGLAVTPLQGKHVVVQRYGDTNVELNNALLARGSLLTEISTYRWHLPEDTQPMLSLLDKLDQGEIDVVCFTSASQVHNLFAVAAQQQREGALQVSLNKSLVASIGPVCSAALRQFSIRVDIEPQPPKLGPFIDAINARFA